MRYNIVRFTRKWSIQDIQNKNSYNISAGGKKMKKGEELSIRDDCGNTYLLKRRIKWDNALILQEPNENYGIIKEEGCPINFAYKEVKTVGRYLVAFYKEEFIKTRETHFHIYDKNGEPLMADGKKIVGKMYVVISIYGIKVLTEEGKILYIT